MERTISTNVKRCTLLDMDVTQEFCREKCRIQNCSDTFRSYISQHSNEMETKE